MYSCSCRQVHSILSRNDLESISCHHRLSQESSSLQAHLSKHIMGFILFLNIDGVKGIVHALACSISLENFLLLLPLPQSLSSHSFKQSCFANLKNMETSHLVSFLVKFSFLRCLPFSLSLHTPLYNLWGEKKNN